ncbi:tetratricopeptide repeat protein, partial [Streptomyces sp. NPDC002454]
NAHLDRLHKEAHWTQGQFARSVNAIGTERGTPTTFGESTVHYWRKGAMPREGVRKLILEALSRRLDRPVSHADAGFPGPAHEAELHSITEELIEMGRQDMERRSLLSASLFSVAMTVPDWSDVVGRMEAVQSGTRLRIGMPEVETVTKMTDRLAGTYDVLGGQHTRPLAAAFLVHTVAPYLRQDGPNEVRKAMLSAAAFLCYITGWMAVDEGAHGLAQKYYVKGLELAGASGDHMTYCHVLRGISVQAVDLGHGKLAVNLANAASASSPQTGPRLRAFMTGQQAHAFAVAGNRGEALRSLREAERSMERAESGSHTFGRYDPATLAYHTSQVRYALGDTAGSVDSLKSHFRLRRSGETRRSALRFNSMMAERQLELGLLDAACTTWNHVLDEYPSVRSGKVDRHVANIGRLLRPYRSTPEAREVHERARVSLKHGSGT